MTDATFKPGDVVRLRSGGPAMTVAIESDGWVHVDWFSRHGPCNDRRFPATSLEELKRGEAVDV